MRHLPSSALLPAPFHPAGFSLSSVANVPLASTWPVPPGSVAHSVHAQRATFPPPLALHNSSTSTQDLLPTLASVLSSRTSAGAPTANPPQGSRLALPPLAAQQQQAAASAGASGIGGEQRDEVCDLLSALEQLQQLQSLISTVVVMQLQQQQARTEAAALLQRRLLPLLSAIQEQLQPNGESSGQVAELLSSLNQLSGMLALLPQPADQQALQLLQWLQASGALGDLPSSVSLPSVTAPPNQQAPQHAPLPPVIKQEAPPLQAPPPLPAPSAAALAVARATPPPDKEQLQAMLERVSGLLKRQEAQLGA